ncbi:MAG: bh protein [Planctomycetia bacterium]|nr:bh protein [Planctomycetia bacterium]
MDVRIVKVEAECAECGEETLNEAVVVGKLLKCRRCMQCGNWVSPGRRVLAEAYFNEAIDRALTKPYRWLRQEHRYNWKGELVRLPLRLLEKLRQEKEYLEALFGPQEKDVGRGK